MPSDRHGILGGEEILEEMALRVHDGDVSGSGVKASLRDMSRAASGSRTLLLYTSR